MMAMPPIAFSAFHFARGIERIRERSMVLAAAARFRRDLLYSLLRHAVTAIDIL